MYKILTKREKAMFIITVGVVIFSVGFHFLIAPVLTKNEELNKEINVTKTQFRKYLQVLSQKEYIQNKYSKYSSTFEVAGHREDTLAASLSELENLAKTSNIRIIDIRPQAPKSSALYKEALIDLRTEGTMENYLKFIYNLENSLSLLRVRRFQINAQPNSPALEGSFSISQLSSLE